MASDTRRLQVAQSPCRIPLGVSMSAVQKERERMSDKYVFLLDIADYLGRTSTAIQGQSKRLGLNPILIRREGTGKAALAVTADEARRIIDANVKKAETISPTELMGGKP